MASIATVELTPDQLRALVLGPGSVVALTSAQSEQVATKEATVVRNTFDRVFERIVALEARLAVSQQRVVELEGQVAEMRTTKYELKRALVVQLAKTDTERATLEHEEHIEQMFMSATIQALQVHARDIKALEAQVAATPKSLVSLDGVQALDARLDIAESRVNKQGARVDAMHDVRYVAVEREIAWKRANDERILALETQVAGMHQASRTVEVACTRQAVPLVKHDDALERHFQSRREHGRRLDHARDAAIAREEAVDAAIAREEAVDARITSLQHAGCN
jgi:uncharacterized coiled-coil protein SlyX